MNEERLQPISLHQEMQRSYLEYAMSVIVGRALPDARDGLKPVQRRILFAMHELGLTPDRPYRKCARVVGDVLGKYHPHGDQAVYDALVRLVQLFSSRYPVLDGHGNFGSVDDDPPAAMRYTETRLAQIAHDAILNEINNDTVDFAPNFDGSQQEPTVLPTQLPFLLLNGCSGIAVGMATSIPPHNLNEIVDGLIALIRKPNLSDEKLINIIPGPDFPTGGEVLIGSGVRETYLKGRGSLPMRGVAHIEEIQPGKGRHKRNAVVVTELPYQLSKAGWIEKLADLVNESKIGSIADIRDESDREGMRIVVELKRDANAEEVLRTLQRRTSFQSNFGAILLALVDGQPKQLSLKELLEQFINYRELTVIRRTKHALNKTQERLEIVKGLTIALNSLRNVIEMLEKAADASSAKAALIINLSLNEKQADAVLSMPLRRLTNLEQNNLKKEADDLETKRKNLTSLLNNREYLLEEIIKELKSLKKRFGNPRRTRLIEGGDELVAERAASQRPNAELQRQQAFAALPNEAKILIQQDNQVKIISRQVLGRLHLDSECELGDEPSPARLILPIRKNPRILGVANNGRIGIVRWEFAGQQPGSLTKFLPGGLEGEEITALIPLPKKKNQSLCLISSDGRVKRLPLEEILELSGRAASIVKLKDGVILTEALICEENGSVLIVSDIGRVLKLPIVEDELPLMGKLAQGPIGMRLFPGEKIAGAISVSSNSDENLVLVNHSGIITTIKASSIRLCRRGDLGDACVELQDKKNKKDRVLNVCNSKNLIGVITSQGRVGRMRNTLTEKDGLEMKQLNLKLKENETIKDIIPLVLDEED